MPNPSSCPARVAAAFDAMPAPTRNMAYRLRAILFDVAERDGVPRLEETLKWGEPAYLPGRSGTTVRIGWDKSSGTTKMLVHCQTSLIETWRARFSADLAFEGNRAVLVKPHVPLNEDAIRICASEAFSYHRRRS